MGLGNYGYMYQATMLIIVKRTPPIQLLGTLLSLGVREAQRSHPKKIPNPKP